MRINHDFADPHAVGLGHVATRTARLNRVVSNVIPRTRTQMHPTVYKLALLCWLGLLAVFWTTFSVSSNALFMVAIGTVYATVFFGVPFLMSRMGPPRAPVQHSLHDFASGRFDTLNGPIAGFDAVLQVVLVPLALAIGGVAIGFIIRSARALY